MNIGMTNMSLWIVPMYQVSREYIKKAGYINTWSKDEYRDDLPEESVVLVFNADTEKKGELINDLSVFWDEWLIDIYPYLDYIVCMAMRIPDQWLDDYYIILAGAYSQVSETYKELVAMNPSSDSPCAQMVGMSLQQMIIEKHTLVKYADMLVEGRGEKLQYILQEGLDGDEDVEVWPAPGTEILTQIEIDKINNNGTTK